MFKQFDYTAKPKKKKAILKLASRKFLPLKYKTTKTETMTKNSSEKFTIKLRKIKKKDLIGEE
jgi:hypothetical protein